MKFAELVATSDAVAATRSRKDKTAALAGLFERIGPDEVLASVALLAGEARQGRIGVGWATVRAVEVEPAGSASLTIGQVDRAIDRLAAISGPGSAADRTAVLAELLGAATAAEADFLRRLLVGEIRQGALAGVVVEGVAKASGVSASAVRRAVMLSGDLGAASHAALVQGADAVAAIGLTVGRPIQPMLASTATDVDDAMGTAARVSVEWKLDGARIQVHKSGDDVHVYTRNLNDVTGRLPTVVEVVRGFPARTLVLDGEAMGFTADHVPEAFQDLISAFARDDDPEAGAKLAPFFFDVVHVDGADILDEPLEERLALLDEVAVGSTVPRVATTDPAVAADFLADSLAAGHEGVMVKALHAPYQAGRRGKAWRKVKPVHTLDLVVLAAEWGHGRRRGWLSNLHLGARNPDGGFVMVGKTFKGLTDELLTWQTERLQALEAAREGITVWVRPELVVEIAVDGVQRSTRYPGGAALRFARVRRYRPDKNPAEADTIDVVRALLPRARTTRPDPGPGRP